MSTDRALRKAKEPTASGGTTMASACAHCGDALAGLKVVERRLGRSTQAFCCQGCAFIAEQLFLAQASGRDRLLLDATVNEAVPTAGSDLHLAQCQVDVSGMVCAACALLIEHKLRREPGVARAQVDFAGRRAYVSFDAARTSEDRVRRVIERAGYRTGDAALAPRQRRIELVRVLLAWLAMMQVMMLAVPAYVAAPGDISPDVQQLLRIAQLVLTVPVMIFSAVPLYRAAVSQLRAGSAAVLGMDLPIVLGLTAAFAASLWATLTSHGPVYYDSITMFVALVLASRWWQAKALGHAHEHVAQARRKLQLHALRLRAWPGSQAHDTVDAAQLAIGDKVLVPPGETVPADGVVAQGATSVSQAWLTGEATPIEKSEGMAVLAGSVNLDQPMVVEVTRAGASTSLATLRRLVDAAGQDRPRIVETANRVAIVFLWVVLGVTLATVVGWWLVDPAQALPNAIAVLVATCPCALSLAAPAALGATQSALAHHGVLTTRVAALEQLARVDTFAFDKTGTLTSSDPALERVVALRSGVTDTAQLIALGASLETLSTHPFARALACAARERKLVLPPITDGRAHASAGVEATVDGVRLRLGKPEYALGHVVADPLPVGARLLQRMEREKLASNSVIVLADRDGPLALFVFGERLREDAARLVRELLDSGAEVALISGDRREPVERVAREVGVERVLAHQTPESKRALVQQWQRDGRRVAMIGDGMNDAPVIAQADVSIALAEGNALAQARADFIALRSRLADVGQAVHAARRGMRVVRQNLAWAFVYNVAAIPLAAFGFLTPALAAVGMAASSALVIANALRAAR
jgi:Cu2+-exporting ATPase